MNNNIEKTVDKKINLSCLIFALALLTASVFAFIASASTMNSSMFGLPELTDEVLEEIMSFGEVLGTLVFPFLVIIFASVLHIIGLVKLIILIVRIFSFFGERESHGQAARLAKFARTSFDIMGISVGVSLLAAADGSDFSAMSVTLFVISGIVYLASYLLVRFYRWFVVDRLRVTDYIFILIRDLLFMVFPIILLGFVSTDCIAQINGLITKMATGVNDMMIGRMVAEMMLLMGEFFLLFTIIAIIRATMKFIPFDNYKKSAPDKIAGSYGGLVAFSLIFLLSAALVRTLVPDAEFDSSVFTSFILDNMATAIKCILATVSVFVAAIVDGDDIVKLAKK